MGSCFALYYSRSVRTLRHQILKSKAKEPIKVLSSSSIRGTTFISVYNFPAQQRPSLGNAFKISKLWPCAT